VAEPTIPFFDLGAQVGAYRDELHGALDRVIDSGYFIGGSEVVRFEERWAETVGVRHCVSVGNGLDAIRLILEGYGIGPGDEVIVPAFTYYATWLAVQQTGATLVPVDVDLRSAAIDADLVAAAVTPRTKAILIVHLFGIPAELDRLRTIADDAGVLLIEDAAQSHGAPGVGSTGDASAFSFYPTKNLGALGDAGGVTTDDADLAARIRSRRSYGQGSHKYEHVDTGWNTRLDPLQAAFLGVHLDRLEGWTRRRRAIAAEYLDALADAPDAFVGPADPEGSVWHHFVLRAADRTALRDALGLRGVGTDIHYPYALDDIAPLAHLVARPAAPAPRAAELAAQVTSLPMGPWMTDGQVQRVADALRELPRALLNRS
jgi:dTDP-3-amino-3,4,6-trideoxy-alpha-D-glucose transaminase